MRIPFYQVDTFTGPSLDGNPAAVCPLTEWLEDARLQAIAGEIGLSDTAFFTAGAEGFVIRWFTPVAEVDLCGHATLASGYVVLNHLEPSLHEASFRSRSGPLEVSRRDDLLVMDFPSQPPVPCTAPPELVKGLGATPLETLRSQDFVALFPSPDEILELEPDMALLRKLDLRGVIATAPGPEADFVSRAFFPKYGIDEDPVTGSAHCALVPFWAERLGRKKLRAFQLSARGGELFCEHRGERVAIAGRASLSRQGLIEVRH